MRVVGVVAPVLAVLVTVVTSAAAAHEYWIAPLDYRIGPGAPIEAEIRVGERFAGLAYPFVPEAYPLARLRRGGDSAPLRTTWGRTPAIAQPALGEGVNRLVVGSEESSLSYDDLSEFEAFLAFAGQPGLADRHRERGLPDAVTEVYQRHAKALVFVQGRGAGRGGPVDAPEGLRHEWVALDDPYSAEPGRPLRFRLLFEGAPAARFPVQILSRRAGEVRQTAAETDAQGILVLPESSRGEILLNAVRILPESDAPEGPHWRSLWTSMTFEHLG